MCTEILVSKSWNRKGIIKARPVLDSNSGNTESMKEREISRQEKQQGQVERIIVALPAKGRMKGKVQKLTGQA